VPWQSRWGFVRGWVAPPRSRLAIGAEVAAAVPDGKTLNGSATDGAGLVFTMSHIEAEMPGVSAIARLKSQR